MGKLSPAGPVRSLYLPQHPPKYYVPILPMILVNGSEGIGTGYSTSIPCYNPQEIAANLELLIRSNGEADLVPMTPFVS